MFFYLQKFGGIQKKYIYLYRNIKLNINLKVNRMKRTMTLTTAIILMISLLSVGNVNAQEEEESTSPFSTGVDLVSTYVWRGSNFSGPSLQPYVELGLGGLSVGAWGSQGFDGFQEMDLYLAYAFEFGLSLGITDYYYPGFGDYFDFSEDSGAHGIEANLGYEIGGLSFGANYIFNESPGAATAGGDMYFELGYGFDNVDLFFGAGDGWHTSDGEFAVCNVGLGTSKDIVITDSFTLPVAGSLIWNPDKELFFIVVGLSF